MGEITSAVCLGFVIAKERVKDIFYFKYLCGQHNTVLRATFSLQATG